MIRSTTSKAMSVERVRIFVVALLGVVAAALLAASPAWAGSPSNVSLGFYEEGAPVTTLKAGDGLGYEVAFNTPSRLQAAANDTITISAPAGTKFPADRFMYQINDPSGGSAVLSHPILSNNGATVTIPLAGSTWIDIPANSRVEVLAGIFDVNVTNPTTPGTYTLSVATSKDTTPANSPSYTIVPNDPASLSVVEGDDQQAGVGEAFATALSAKVTDTYGNAILGQQVTFTAPSSGPSGTFASSSSATDTATTNASGVATASAFTANNAAGAYEVQASSGSLTSAAFSLTNRPGPATNILVELDPQSVRADGSSTTTATATVNDANDNPLSGDNVTFTSNGDQQITATTDNGDGTYTAQVTSTTTVGESTITATDSSVTPTITGTATLNQTEIIAPTVDIARPGYTGIKRNRTLLATFSEEMKPGTLNDSTFKLFQVNPDRSTTQITDVAVWLSADGLKATLNPFGDTPTLLLANTKYRAVVTKGAKDLAGNALDQDPSLPGSQPKVWTFTTGTG